MYVRKGEIPRYKIDLVYVLFVGNVCNIYNTYVYVYVTESIKTVLKKTIIINIFVSLRKHKPIIIMYPIKEKKRWHFK